MDRKLEESSRHGRILAAAKTVFARCGFDNATVEDIAAAAGVSKGSIYCHFRDKEDLFCHVVQNVVTDDVASAISASPPLRSAVQRLDYLLETLFRRTAAACECGNLVFELWASASTNHASLCTPLVSAYRRWRSAIKDILDEGRNSGEFNASIDTEAAASLIMAALSGIIVISRFGEGDELARLDKMRHGLLLAVSAW